MTLRGEAIEVDVTRLRLLAASDDIEDLAEAARLYQGELLAGFTTSEEAYEEWLRTEREAMRKTAVDVLSRLAEGQLASGNAETAVASSETLVALDPMSERAHRLLMRTFNEAGRRSAALQQYRICKELLRQELDVEPEAETKALLDAIKRQGDGDEPGDGITPAAPEPSPGRDQGGREKRPTIPDKPSIAVLPFDNMSGEPGQEFFADGIAEDVITALCRFRSIFVIARNSTFTYKGRAVNVTEVARDLGVRYVVEGSVRKDGNRVRVTAQLVEAETGNHVWAEHYDRDLADIFEVQDAITEQIVVAIAPEIEARERERARRKPPASLDAWELIQRGLSHLYRLNKTDRAEAIRLFEAAIALDPEFATAHAHLAFAFVSTILFAYPMDRTKAAATAGTAAEQAVSLDPNDPLAHYVRGRIHLYSGEIEMAIGEMQTAIAINPNFALGHHGLGFAYHTDGAQVERALPHYDTALRLSPRDPWHWVTLMVKSWALRFLGSYDEAIAICRQACQFPDKGFLPQIHLAAALADAGQNNEAQAAVEKAMQIEPALSIGLIRDNFVETPILEELLDSLRKAGLPE